MIHATRLFHSLLHFCWILLLPPFIRQQLKMPPRGGSSSCSAQFYLYHKFYYGAFYKLVIQLNAFPMKQTTTKMDYARNCEFSWNAGFEYLQDLQAIHVSESTNPVLFILAGLPTLPRFLCSWLILHNVENSAFFRHPDFPWNQFWRTVEIQKVSFLHFQRV